MRDLRTYLQSHRWLTVWLVLAACAMKVLVPGGYMVSIQARVITVQLCDDTGTGHRTTQFAIPMKPGSGQSEHGKGDGPCPYSSLTHASLAGADLILLALALAFILALGFLPLAPPSSRSFDHLRPPLRGPPAFA